MNITTIRPTWKTWENPEYGLYLIDIIRIIISVPIGILHFLGLFGNFLTICVCIQIFKQKHKIVDYLLILAIFDALSLLSFGITDWMDNFVDLVTDSRVNFDMVTFRPIPYWCKMIRATMLTAEFGSAWITVLLSFERVIVINFPLKSVRWISPRKRRITFAIVILIAIGIFGLFFTAFARSNSISFNFACLINEEWEFLTLVIASINIVIPFVTMLICGCFLISSLYRQNKILEESNEKKEQKLAILKFVIFVITVFIICNLPFMGFSIYMQFILPYINAGNNSYLIYIYGLVVHIANFTHTFNFLICLRLPLYKKGLRSLREKMCRVK